MVSRFGSFLQVVVIVLFFKACWNASLGPEPLWNPPTVNCAVTSIVGAHVLGGRHWIVLSFFLYALASQTGQEPGASPSLQRECLRDHLESDDLTWSRRGCKGPRRGEMTSREEAPSDARTAWSAKVRAEIPTSGDSK